MTVYRTDIYRAPADDATWPHLFSFRVFGEKDPPPFYVFWSAERQTNGKWLLARIETSGRFLYKINVSVTESQTEALQVIEQFDLRAARDLNPVTAQDLAANDYLAKLHAETAHHKNKATAMVSRLRAHMAKNPRRIRPRPPGRGPKGP